VFTKMVKAKKYVANIDFPTAKRERGLKIHLNPYFAGSALRDKILQHYDPAKDKDSKDGGAVYLTQEEASECLKGRKQIEWQRKSADSFRPCKLCYRLSDWNLNKREGEDKSGNSSSWKSVSGGLKRTENIALVVSLLTLILAAPSIYREWCPSAPRAKLTIFIEHPNIWRGSTNETEVHILGKIVNDSPLTASIKEWDLFIALNISYTILVSSFNFDPKDLTISPTEELNYTMGKTLIGENNTRIPENSIRSRARGSSAYLCVAHAKHTKPIQPLSSTRASLV